MSRQCCKSAERSPLHDAKTIEALFEAAGVADWDATLVENGIDSLKLAQLIKVTSPPFHSSLITSLPGIDPARGSHRPGTNFFRFS